MTYNEEVGHHKIILEQQEDCCGRTDVVAQELTIELPDGGCGCYLVIKTKRWAFDLDGLKEFVNYVEKLIKHQDKVNDKIFDGSR